MQKKDCDSSLVHRLGVLAGAAQFTKNPDDEVRRKLHDAIVDLWTGSGKHCEKAEAAAQSGDKRGEYAFTLELEHEISAADIEEELPPELAEARAKHDLTITQPSRFIKPTEWEFRLKFWQTRDRIYKAMMEGRRDHKKRKREEEVKDQEEAPAPPAWATALTWKCADGVERTLLDRQLIYRGIFDAPAAAGLTERAPARDWAASLSEPKAKEEEMGADGLPLQFTPPKRTKRAAEESPFDKPMKGFIVYFMRDGKEENSGEVCVDDGSQYIQVSVKNPGDKTRIMAVDRDEVYLIPGIAERAKPDAHFLDERPVTLLQGNQRHLAEHESKVNHYVQFHFDGGKEWAMVTKDEQERFGTYEVSLQDERGAISLTINQSRVLKFQREKPTGADYKA